MRWRNQQQHTPTPALSEMCDLAFRMRTEALPVDHAWALYQEICTYLPWFEHEQRAGIHQIHPAQSGNGWFQPDDEPGALIHPSRRTPLTLRVPTQRFSDACSLVGKTMNIEGIEIHLGEVRPRPIIACDTLFARHVLGAQAADEEQFVAWVITALDVIGIDPDKLLCGKFHTLRTPDRTLHTRGVLLAELSTQDSTTLQNCGIGDGRKLGCGLFVPHKDLAAVRSEQQD